MRFIHTSLQSSVTQDAAKRPCLQHSCVSVILLHKRLAACEVNVSKEGSTSYLPKPKTAVANLSQNWWKWSELSEWKQVPEETYVYSVYILSTFPGWWLNQPIWKIWVNWESFPNMDENKKCLSCHHLVSSWQTSQESLTKFCKIVVTSQVMTHFLVGQAACSCASTKPPERCESWKGSAQRW